MKETGVVQKKVIWPQSGLRVVFVGLGDFPVHLELRYVYWESEP